MKGLKKHKGKLFILVLILLAILPVLSLFHPGLTWTQDGQDQVARIANFYQSLTEGNIIPRWAGNLNWGYGHPILEFLYPLPSYIASVLHFTGLSLVDSAKIVYGLGMVLSLIFMYLWLSKFLGRWPSLLGAVLYTYAPYRFIDLYVRGDIGENLAFALIPPVLFFIYKLYKKNDYRFTVFGAISLALLILAHNAVSLVFMPFILFYGAYLLYLSKNRKSYIINLISLIILGFGLAAFFWIPGLLEGKYTLRNIVTKGGYLDRFVSFSQLIYGGWNYGQTGQFTVQLGAVNWIALIFSPVAGFLYFKKKDKSYILIAALVAYCIVAIFLMLPVSNFIWERFMLLQNFQFPWRFLSLTVFSTAVLGALGLQLMPKKYRLAISVILVIAILFLSKDYMKPKGYLYKQESFYTGIYNGTTDTGESAPIWSVRFMEHRPKAPMEVITGKAVIKEVKRTSTVHLYSVDVLQDSRFLENTLYFPGWEITANAVPLTLQFQDPKYRGLMTFNLTKGRYIVEAKYGETKLREMADLISMLSLLCLIGLFIYKSIFPVLSPKKIKNKSN